MSSNFVRFQEILNQAFAENFICLTQKLANSLNNLALHFLIGIPFSYWDTSLKAKTPTIDLSSSYRKAEMHATHVSEFSLL